MPTPTAAPSSRISATTRSAAESSATWCTTFAAETLFASCCLKARMSTSTPSRWAHCRTMRRISPAIPRSTSLSPSNIRKLRAKYGKSVRYAQDKTAHLKTEFGFDTVQVAKNRYASQQYHDFIGFQVSKPLLERVFPVVYGVELKDVLTHEDLAVGSYRFAVSRLIPRDDPGRAADSQEGIDARDAGFRETKSSCIVSRAPTMKRSGERTTRSRASARGSCQRCCDTCRESVPSRVWRSIIRLRKPRICISRASTRPSISTESFSKKCATTNSCFPTAILIVASRPRPAEYSLTDDAYAKLLAQLSERKFDLTSPELRDNILQFYSDLTAASRRRRTRFAGKTS